MGNYTSFDQVLDDLQSLNQATENIRQKIVSATQVAYDSQDARHVALEGIQCDIGACGNWICCLMSLKHLSQEHFSNSWDQEYRKMIGTCLSTGQAEDIMLNYLRNTLIIKIHFKIENLFVNILRELNALPKRRGFWHISDAMLNQAGMTSTGYEKNVLTVLASLRNSFHANGIHKNDDLSIDIDGVFFEFQNGKRVECASWLHIVKAIRANISILKTILLSDVVLSLNHEIRDEFAWEN